MTIEESGPDEIIAALQEMEVLTAQGLSVPQAVHALGISEETFYRWKEQYGASHHARRIRALEEENVRLRRIIAKQALDIAVLKPRGAGPFSTN
jgi:putative transposase